MDIFGLMPWGPGSWSKSQVQYNKITIKTTFFKKYFADQLFHGFLEGKHNKLTDFEFKTSWK